MENLVNKDTMQDDKCLNAQDKHLSQAYIEALQGYAVGHLGEAERETLQDYKDFSDRIRNLRIKMIGQVNDVWSLQDLQDITSS